jgi:transposase InsO family protein
MTEVEWQGVTVDCILVCVDRATGWIIARPTRYAGLTGERAAHLMLDVAWGEIGVPAVVTSDQGAQFVSSWWKAMCARLGMRQVFSQAHRPQANGRAETAGKVLYDTGGVAKTSHRVFAELGRGITEGITNPP